MEPLLKQAQSLINTRQPLPFAIYHCQKPQLLRRVPIFKPVIVFILQGEKHLGGETQMVGKAGEFIFLAENTEVTISNIPDKQLYMALFIEFEHSDFEGLKSTRPTQSRYLKGKIDSSLSTCLGQFIDWARITPNEFWPGRRRELLQLLYSQGYKDIASMQAGPRIQHLIIDIFKTDPATAWSLGDISQRLSMSESTIRRKLQMENTSFRHISIQFKLAYGMHLLQTSDQPISLIAEKCGYQSPSRFTEKFRQWFGVTPKKLRQCQMNETG